MNTGFFKFQQKSSCRKHRPPHAALGSTACRCSRPSSSAEQPEVSLCTLGRLWTAGTWGRGDESVQAVDCRGRLSPLLVPAPSSPGDSWSQLFAFRFKFSAPQLQRSASGVWPVIVTVSKLPHASQANAAVSRLYASTTGAKSSFLKLAHSL